MADALALTIQSGRITRLQTGDALQVKSGAGNGVQLDASGDLYIGTTATTDTIHLGRTGQNVQIDGNEVVIGTTTFQGDTVIGDDLADTLKVGALIINATATPVATNASLQFLGTTPHVNVVDDAGNDAAGQAITQQGGIGGLAVSAAQAGGASIIVGGVGGLGAAATFNAGAGGAAQMIGGVGGLGGAATDGADGGAAVVTGGVGGGAGGGTAGDGGAVNIDGGTGLTGGAVSIDAGVGSGTDGAITIGGTTAVSISSGNAADNPLWTHTGTMSITNAAAPAAGQLNITQLTTTRATAGNYAEAIECVSTGTDAAAFSILYGVDNPNDATAVNDGDLGSLFVDTVGLALYQKTAASTWVAFASGGGNTLQQAYNAGPDITQDNTDLGMTITRGANAEAAPMLQLVDATEGEDILTITKSAALGGRGLFIDMGSAVASTGIGLEIATGATATGDALFINNQGTGAALTVQVDSSDVLDISGAGAVTVSVPAGAAIDVDSTDGNITINSTTGLISLNTTTGSATMGTSVGAAGIGGIITLLSQATTGTAGDIDVQSRATGALGSSGAVSITALSTSASTGTAGTVNVESFTSNGAGSANTSDVTIRSFVTGTGTCGDVLIHTSATNGTDGGVTVQAASNGAPATPGPGQLILRATADVDLDGSSVTIDGSVAGVAITAATTMALEAATSTTINTTTGPTTVSTTTSGTLSLTSAGIVDMDGTSVDIDATNGAVTIDSATLGVSIDGVQSSNLSITANTANPETLTVAVSNAGAGTGNIDIDADEAITIDSSAGGISLGAAAASDFTVTNSTLTLTTVTDGVLTISSADTLDVDAANAITIDSAAAGVSIQGAGASDFSTSTGGMTISSTAGALALSTVTSGDVTITAAGATGDIDFVARGGSAIPFSEAAPDNALVGFTATSIVGALNELAGGGTSVFTVEYTMNSSTGAAAGAPIALQNQAGSPVAVEADSDGAGTLPDGFGIALAAAVASATVQVVLMGEVDVADAQWDTVNGTLPAVADVGQPFFISETQGSLFFDSGGGQPAGSVTQLGVISRGGTGAIRVTVSPVATVNL